ncbi:hypothetical protein GCM10023195_72380 [Actinoallomurus liliacearum]|uniref:Uncharacterized protein n=1 Tax=Actinoallomurus liliacearum TaxID=1080073 RepID=A0ABP8TTS5_9ACTN
MGLRIPLQHKDGAAREAKLAGEEQTNRAGAHDHYIMHENVPSEARRPVLLRHAKTAASRSHGTHTALTWGRARH